MNKFARITLLILAIINGNISVTLIFKNDFGWLTWYNFIIFIGLLIFREYASIEKVGAKNEKDN